MTGGVTPCGRIYVGMVTHKRLRPREHSLRYRVFSLLLDVDRIDEAAAGRRYFSRNRWNLVAFFDRDHGAGDGRPVGTHCRELLARAGIDVGGGRIWLLCYPRVLGYVFNPLSVYYAHDEGGALRGIVYEVSNTFGERRSYVIPVRDPGQRVIDQSCAKEMYVSPFAAVRGRYGFRVVPPGDDIVLAVTFRDAEGPLIKTMFKADARPFSDRGLLQVLAAMPLMTLKVIAAIHLEAAKLWWKGVPVVQRLRSPRYAVSTTSTNRRALP